MGNVADYRTNDADIRRSLLTNLQATLPSDALIIPELVTHYGTSRVDVAVLNGEFTGYEIKSDRDTLDRLRRQMRCYNQVFDKVVAVAAGKYIGEIAGTVPEWWGLIEAVWTGDGVNLRTIREPQANPAVEVAALVQFLWRGEALATLEQHGLAKGKKSLSRRRLWKALAAELTLEQVKASVAQCMRDRGDWREGGINGVTRVEQKTLA